MPSDSGHRVFLSEFFRDLRHTGAIAPSSPWLARRLVEAADIDDGHRVIEVGPGTGAFTTVLADRVARPENLLVVERNPRFASHLRYRFPRHRVLTADAVGLPGLLTEAGWKTGDRLVSGLPWASFSADLQDRLLQAMAAALHPTACLVTFAYFGPHWLPQGRTFRARLGAAFHEVTTTPVEWLNLPPAFVYVARRPRKPLSARTTL